MQEGGAIGEEGLRMWSCGSSGERGRTLPNGSRRLVVTRLREPELHPGKLRVFPGRYPGRCVGG